MMHKLYLIAALFLFNVSCLSIPKNTYRQACEYPKLDLIVGWATIHDSTGTYQYFSYDLDGDVKPDVKLRYPIIRMDTTKIICNRYPQDIIWIDKENRVYAVQRDSDFDGKINSVSGDVSKLIKTLKRLNRYE